MGSAPDPTPPKETATASNATNTTTAISNAFMQNMNETTPYGSKSVSVDSWETIKDPYTGQNIRVPKFSVEQTLSEQQQGLLDANTATQQSLANLAGERAGYLSDYYEQNPSFDYVGEGDQSRQRVEEAIYSRLEPQLAQDREALRTRLVNQGINEGSEAFDRAMSRADQQATDARMQAVLSGGQEQSRLAQLEMAARSQPLNELTALMGGSQVSQPNFMTGAGVAGAPTTDVASIIGNYDQQKMNQWQQNQAMIGSTIGSLGSAFGLMLSDERAKEDKEKIAETEDGMSIYKFRYKGDPTVQLGLMAQDVKKKKPGAVKTTPSGLMAVDYGKAV